MRWLLLLVTLSAACAGTEPREQDDAGSLSDASRGAATPDAGSSADASSADVAAAPLDAGVPISDAGEFPCEVDCAPGLQCRVDRCIETCPCAPEQQCHAPTQQCLPSRCGVDRDCPHTMSCVLSRCSPTQPRCQVASDCPEGQRCSVLRRCTDQACLTHHDCSDAEFCSAGRCLERIHADPAVLFERVYLPALETFHSPLPNFGTDRSMLMTGEWGYGATLLDIDGDLDLDLFLASQAWSEEQTSHACLFRNDSLPGQVRFEPVEAHCGWREQAVHSAFATDLDGDGVHELILGGLRYLVVHVLGAQPRTIDLIAQLTPEQAGSGCLVGSMVSVDLNLDGLLDLVVGCQSELSPFELIEYRKLVFLQTPDQNFEPADASNYRYAPALVLSSVGNTLALGAADVNGDGLQDLMVSHDSVVRDAETPVEPGGIYLRCSPDRRCDFEERALDQGLDRFGAFMGSGLLQLEQVGEAAYFTDWGANRLVPMSGESYGSIAPDWRADLSMNQGAALYSWGVVVDDFNRDGRDDLFVAQGSVKGGRPFDYRAHEDVILLQGQGRFSAHSAEVGIPPFTTDDSGDERYVYASRAALKTDWDYDGLLDLMVTSLEGAPRILREVPLASHDGFRCTLIPRARYAPGFGTGYRVKANGAERAWDSQGQIRSGASPFIVTPYNAGHLRFPSGALIPYDCAGRTGPVLVVEPDWLSLSLDGDQLRVERGAHAPLGAARAYAEPTGEAVTLQAAPANAATGVLPEGTTRVLLKFGERWLPRWFEVESIP
ncbi:MAG: VCBS repeat-containing protein [Myxococcota bacterium]|nr:VCBS repeat-containing protein [Myxococcota bacterium]